MEENLKNIDVFHTQLQLLVQNYANLNVIIDLLVDIKTSNDDLQKKELYEKIKNATKDYRKSALDLFVEAK